MIASRALGDSLEALLVVVPEGPARRRRQGEEAGGLLQIDSSCGSWVPQRGQEHSRERAPPRRKAHCFSDRGDHHGFHCRRHEFRSRLASCPPHRHLRNLQGLADAARTRSDRIISFVVFVTESTNLHQVIRLIEYILSSIRSPESISKNTGTRHPLWVKTFTPSIT